MIILRVLQCLYQYNIPDVILEGILEKIQRQMIRECHYACREISEKRLGTKMVKYKKISQRFFKRNFGHENTGLAILHDLWLK